MQRRISKKLRERSSTHLLYSLPLTLLFTTCCGFFSLWFHAGSVIKEFTFIQKRESLSSYTRLSSFSYKRKWRCFEVMSDSFNVDKNIIKFDRFRRMLFQFLLTIKHCPATCHAGAKEERWYSSYSFLTTALYGGEWSPSHSGRSLLQKRIPGTHWTGGWVDPRAGLHTEAAGKILCQCLGSNPCSPFCSQTLNWLNYLSSYFNYW
jgi:hypothetical protein